MTDEFSLLEFFFSMVWFCLFIVWIFFLVTLIGDIFKSRDLFGIQKARWMVFLVFLPFIAAIAYLIARGDRLRERQVEAAAEPEEALCRRLNVPTSAADEISKLAGLRDSGALSEEEFQTQKARLLVSS